MVAPEMPTVRRSPEWWLFAAAVAVAVVMLVAPLAIPAGVGVMVFAAVLLGKRPRRAGPLIGAIVVLSVSLVVIAAVGFATSIAASTSDHGVTLINE